MKQNITLSLDAKLIRQARVRAAKRRLSVSKLLAEELAAHITEARDYDRAKKQALAYLEHKFPLGGASLGSREALHDRAKLR